MTASAAVKSSEDVSASTACRLLWLAVFFDLMAFGVGFAPDRRWHAAHPFEDFFSPAVTGALDLYLRARTP